MGVDGIDMDGIGMNGIEKGDFLLRLTEDDLSDRARDLVWMLLDVDGLLTDGRLFYGSDGGVRKAFDTRDGFGIKLAQWAGIKVGLLTGRADAGVLRRADELGLDAVVAGRQEKAPALAEFLARQGLTPERVAYGGDDLPDLPVLVHCGLSFAPADAVPEVRERVDVVLSRPGGRGAVREMVELLLRARGQWREITERFLDPAPLPADSFAESSDDP